MLKKKNDYSVIVYFEDGTKPKKWTYVDKLNGFSMFLHKSHSTWKYMNVYNRRSAKYIRRFYRDSFIPAHIQE
ncbi:hypothetical protein [Gillisia sp. Hel1_33_143]|uniref:hypothetical protein n=1 Tax=Gillisia sp. Hel1_33_143 TaxID=1336796 RepID=UPI000B854B31|nr:hypothetical protein [Gillisia sp. Hel1_33_143]